jgi:glucosamine-6-phosphate deaminase
VDVRVVEPDELDAIGTSIVASWLRARPTATLMPALGSSALGIYRGLAEMRAAGRLVTDRLTLVQLDEYLGLAPDDRRSLIGWLRRDVADPLRVADQRIVRLPGDARDADNACRTYDAAVAAAGGIDVAVLGLGPNGHLGFNEPPSPADAPTRVVDLSEASVTSNARYWGGPDEVPRRALTAGMPTILGARRALLVVAGAGKTSILRRVVTAPVSPDVPASFLRTIGGGAVTLLADRGAWPSDVAIPATIGS